MQDLLQVVFITYVGNIQFSILNKMSTERGYFILKKGWWIRFTMKMYSLCYIIQNNIVSLQQKSY